MSEDVCVIIKPVITAPSSPIKEKVVVKPTSLELNLDSVQLNNLNNEQIEKQMCKHVDPEMANDNCNPFVRAHHLRRSFSLDDIVNYHQNNMQQELDGANYSNVNVATNYTSQWNGQFSGLIPSSEMHNKLTQGWLGGVLGCFKPIIGIISSKGFKDNKMNSCEIPYENLKDMHFLGSGAQGSVYVGKFSGLN